ncbi:hypothetical protein [Desulfofundulus sp.]|uniref:hypothetical protein n=1 Tax=Desulfofundulus sp. TaxID=2282750 RepID=UPI003C74FD8E
MLKMMFSFVGEQDPFSEKTGEEGSVVTLCRHLNPNVVYLFPTAAGYGVKSETQTNADFTREWILKEVGVDIGVFIKPLALNDPTDYSSILPRVRKEVGEVLTALAGQEVEIHLNCSSGTPQLKSTWIILANAGLFRNCHLWQVSNPLYADGKRVKEIEVTFLEEENIISRLNRYCREFLFQRMAEEAWRLQQISIYSYRRDKAALVQRIFLAYQSWDLIRYNDAYQRLNSVLSEIINTRDLRDLAALLERQVRVLKLLKANTERETYENLIDLYFSARRRFIRGDYTDTLARFWRIYEGTLYKQLREKYGIEPAELSRSTDTNNLEIIKKYASNHPWELSPNIKKLGIHASEIVLEKIFKDKTYSRLIETVFTARRGSSFQKLKLGTLLDELRDRRNYSIVAHGMKPVSEEDAENSLAVLEEVFKVFFDGGELLMCYPFQEEDLRLVISVLSQAFALL